MGARVGLGEGLAGWPLPPAGGVVCVGGVSHGVSRVQGVAVLSAAFLTHPVPLGPLVHARF